MFPHRDPVNYTPRRTVNDVRRYAANSFTVNSSNAMSSLHTNDYGFAVLESPFAKLDLNKDFVTNHFTACIIEHKLSERWSDIVGLETVKRDFELATLVPEKFPELFEGKRKISRSFLLYGPTGAGKNMLVRALASETRRTLIAPAESDLVSKYKGESAKLITALFEFAREHKPSIIFIYGVEALTIYRNGKPTDEQCHISTTFLAEMKALADEKDAGVIVIAASNQPWLLRDSVVRSFAKCMYVGLPAVEARKKLFELKLRGEVSLTAEEIAELAALSEGFTGYDIRTAINDAHSQPMYDLCATEYMKKVDSPAGRAWKACAESDTDALKMTWEDIPDGDEFFDPPMTMARLTSAVRAKESCVTATYLAKFQSFLDQYGEAD